MGVIGIEEYVQALTHNTINVQLYLDVSYEDIINHPAIAIEIGNKMAVPIGCSYIPTQNII